LKSFEISEMQFHAAAVRLTRYLFAMAYFLLTINIIMAALRSRCGHYIFALWFLSFFLSFFLA